MTGDKRSFLIAPDEHTLSPAEVVELAKKKNPARQGPSIMTAVAETEDYRWPYSGLLLGVLLQFDLPDCYKGLDQRDLKQIKPWGAMKRG